MSKTNIITFKSVDEIAFAAHERPFPASRAMPNWWKQSNSSIVMNQDHTLKYSTFKKCTPMLDAISAGYIIPLHSDIEVFQTDNGPFLRWNGTREVASLHIDERVDGLEIPEGYDKMVFKYHNSWIIQTPPGWSTLVTHPLGYKNLPIHSFTGIADSDVFHGDINVPFVIKKGFIGIIPKGTPMCQVIPIKRENWQSEAIEGTRLEQQKIMHILYTKISGGYNKMFRKPKEYK